ncbi:MAG: enoyl-CoA hydratase/isomerase family protein [Planctomycetota bacterium]
MTVLKTEEGRLTRITLARPPLNILDIASLEQLADAIESVGDETAVIVIDSDVPRAFSAGNDVADHKPERAPAMLQAFHRAIRGLLEAEAVTVADVRADAFGGGCEIVAACDLAYATPAARFGQPEIEIACFPPVAASLLPARIGQKRAADLVLTGRRIDAETAAAWGLISGVDENGAAPAIGALLQKSAPALKAAKLALRSSDLAAAERIYLDRLLGLDDYAEGIQAFLAKRPSEWRHS